MHNPMFVSQVAQTAWHAWMLCRLLMADLRARKALPSGGASEDDASLAEDEAAEMAE